MCLLQCFSQRTCSVFRKCPGDALLAIESGQNPHRSEAECTRFTHTKQSVAQRGRVSRELIQAFLDAGTRRTSCWKF